MTARRGLVLGLGLLAASAAPALAAEPAGWRGDGTAVFAEATPPATWTDPTWHTDLSAGGNASPVLADGRLIVTANPTRLLALDPATGRILWSHEHPVIDALPDELAAEVRPTVQRAPQLEAELAQARKDYALLLRQARRGAPEATPEALSALDARMQSLQATLDSVAPYRTPDTGDGLSYASPTPAFDGEHLFVLFANGVVASYTLDGTRRWMRWLGVRREAKNGYSGVDAASPVRVGDDLLAVPFGTLHGLDAATGETRWTGPAYPHFGTPAVTTVGSIDVLITPDGLVLDAATGAVQPAKLDVVYYCAPSVADDGRIHFAGSDSGYNETDPVFASAWTLQARDDGIHATRDWKTTLPSRDRVYSHATLYGDHHFIVSRFKRLVVVRRSDGAIVHERVLSDEVGEVWANPTVAGGRVYVPTIQGTLFSFSAEPPFGDQRSQPVSPSPTSPWFEGQAVFWRGETGVSRFDAP